MTHPPEKLTIDSILKYIEDNPKVYGKRYPAAVLIHELEHVRRHTSHIGDSHSDTIIDGKSYTFDEAANIIYDQKLQEGLLNKIVSDWNKRS